MNFSQQEKRNASERMQTLFNAINNEMKSSLTYVGSMKKGNRDTITYNNGKFDIDANIELNIDIDEYNAQEIYSDIVQIIKRCLRDHEHYDLKSAKGSKNLIIYLWSENVNYTFDIAIVLTDGSIMKYDPQYDKKFWWD